jgi:hypothetical protein
MGTMTPEDMETLAHLYANKDVRPFTREYIKACAYLGGKYPIHVDGGHDVWHASLESIKERTQ